MALQIFFQNQFIVIKCVKNSQTCAFIFIYKLHMVQRKKHFL